MIKALLYGSNFSPILPILIGGYLIKKNSTRYIYIILALIFISFGSDMITFYYGRAIGNTYWVINCYFIGEIFLTGYFFYYVLNPKKLIAILTAISLSIFLCLIIFIDFNTYYGSFLAINSLINMTWCILFFYTLFKEEKEIYIERLPIFWFSIALLTYFSGSFFTFILSTQILNSPLPYSFLHLANILKNILFAIGLWKVRAVA